MNFPYYIEVANTKILLHVITEPLGIFIAYKYYQYLRRKHHDIISLENRLYILIGAAIGALIFSRLIGGLENPIKLFEAKNKLLFFYENKTVLGGLLGGLLGVELIKKIIKEKNSSGDLFTYPIILALIIGRIGCFSMGVYEETYGLPTTFFCGMNLGDNICRHPVSIYEIIFLLILWIGLLLLEKKYEFISGAKFKYFMIAYVLFRFFLDFIKPHFTFNFGLSTIQIVCLIGLLYYFLPSNFKDLKLKKRFLKS